MRARLNGREIEGVLVDAGGVLVDPNFELIAEILGRHGVDVEPGVLAAADYHAKREFDDPDVISDTTDLVRRERFLARILRHAGVEADPAAVEAATDEVDELHRQRFIWEVVTPGAPEALAALRAAGLRLSLASNAEALLRPKLEQLGLAQRFDHLAISAEVGFEKPDPRFFESALAGIGVAAERAIHIGDFYNIDIVGARSAGVEGVLVDAAGLSTDRHCPRIRALADLPALIGLDEKPESLR